MPSPLILPGEKGEKSTHLLLPNSNTRAAGVIINRGKKKGDGCYPSFRLPKRGKRKREKSSSPLSCSKVQEAITLYIAEEVKTIGPYLGKAVDRPYSFGRKGPARMYGAMSPRCNRRKGKGRRTEVRSFFTPRLGERGKSNLGVTPFSAKYERREGKSQDLAER